MTRDEAGRHCSRCSKRVHDLTRMTERRAQAYALLFGGDGGLCARMRIDEGGYGVFREPPRSRSRATLPAFAAVVTIGCGGAQSPVEPAGCAPVARIVDVPSPPRGTASTTLRGDPSTHADRDRDGHPDRADTCPDDPATTDSSDGCPVPHRIILAAAGDMAILQGVEFTSGSTSISKLGTDILDEMAQLILAHPEIVRVIVHGHADDRESNADALSLRRAQVAVAQLVKLGVDPQRLEARGAGSHKPLDNNATPEGRHKNRRVELSISP